VEREREIEMISAQLDAAVGGLGSLTVIEGQAGIGKTSLLDAAVSAGHEKGMTVIRAEGSVREHPIEFGLLRRLFETELDSADPDVPRRLFAGPAAPAGAILGFGELPEDPGPGQSTADPIHRGIFWLLVNLAERAPVLAVIDDMHWADRASLLAICHLAKRVEGESIALVVGTRTEEPGFPTEELSAVVAEADGMVIRPAPLSAEGIGEILGRRLPARRIGSDLVAACGEATGGNPFFLTELAIDLGASGKEPTAADLATIVKSGPESLKHSILLRIGSMGEDAGKLAAAVALTGGQISAGQVAAVAELEPDRAYSAMETLVAAGILRPGPVPEMVHPVVRSTVEDDLSETRRREIHRRAFEELQGHGSTDDALVAHALGADPVADPAVSAVLRRTADRALRTGSPEISVMHLRRALAEPPDADEAPRVMAELGQAEIRVGEFAGGMDHLEEALGRLTDVEARIRVHRDRAFAAFASGGMEKARDLVVDALAEIGDRDTEGALRLEADLATLAWLSGSDSGIDLRRHLGVTGATAAERTILGLLAQEEHATGGHPDLVVDLANRAIGGGRMIAEDTSEALAWYMATYSLLTCEAFAEARVTIDQALADGHRRGSSFAVAGALGCRSVLTMNEGRLVAAEADALVAASGDLPPIMRPVNASFTVRALSEQGKLEEAERVMIEAGIEHGPGGPTVLRWIPWGRAVLHENQGKLDLVREDVAPMIEDDRAGRSMKALSWRALLARTIAREGPSDEAEALAAEHLEWAGWWGRPGALGVAERALALSGSADLRSDRMRAAVETLGRSSLRAEESRARVDLGVSLLADGRADMAREELESGLELSVECGARLVAETAVRHLRECGVEPKRFSFDVLTASERRVAEIAAAGSSNREIAEQLLVTPKTVENHLTRVYSKLGIDSRRELATAL